MWPAELPPRDGSTTALAVLIVQRFPAEVRLLVELPELLELLVLLVDPVDGGDELVEVVLGWGVGVGELLHAARAVARPAAASATHTERTGLRPCVVTPPR
jgi:hypothetical protein